jgi:hypothetical protein
MSLLMIGPGPLEGGPMVSPGPAKNGDDFSEHLKNACDPSRGETPPVREKPSPRSSAVGGGAPAGQTEEFSEGLPANNSLVPVGTEEPEGILPFTPVTVPTPVDHTVEALVQEEEEGLTPEIILEVKSSDCPSMPIEKTEDVPVLSKSEKEDLAKIGLKLLESIVPVPLLMGSPVVEPTDLNRPIGTEMTVVPEETEPVLVPAVLDGTEGVTPTADVRTVGVEPVQEPDFPMQNPENMDPTVPPELKEAPKKRGESRAIPVLVPGDEIPPSPDQSGLPPSLNPKTKIFEMDRSTPVTQNQEKEVPRDASPTKDVPSPSANVHPTVLAPVSQATESIPSYKEIPGISSVHARTAGQVGDPAPLASGIISQSVPVTARASAKAELPAPPAATPSPVDLARQIHVHLESGRSVVRIDLHPDHLGELRISLETKGKDVSMQFTVDNDHARTAVVAGLREITGTLSSLGWNVNGLAVNVSSGGVGDGRGETPGTLWNQGKPNSNNLQPDPSPGTPPPATEGWRVNLVA